jgi:hypothetical protein
MLFPFSMRGNSELALYTGTAFSHITIESEYCLDYSISNRLLSLMLMIGLGCPSLIQGAFHLPKLSHINPEHFKKSISVINQVYSPQTC